MIWLALSLMSFLGKEGSALPGYRLPDNIKPTHYRLDLITDLEGFTFSGKLWIEVQCLKATNSIVLHSKKLTILEDEVTVKELVNNVEGPAVTVSNNRDVPENEFHIIKVDQSLKPNKQYVVFIPFSGMLTPTLSGFYRSSYFDRMSNETKWLGVTQFEPTHARSAFPCFDEPEMKAQFTIKLGHKNVYKSISNMPVEKTYPLEGKKGWIWNQFEKSVPMSTYLVAWMVSEFEYEEAPSRPNNVTFRIWARQEAIGQVNFAKKVGPEVLEFYEKYFDLKYPLPKQDMAAIPDFSAGAMENWGLITYRETDLLYDEKATSIYSKERVAYVIAHELAHQWFGNLVTMKWWTDLWLNEGFATYVGCLGIDHVFPNWDFVRESALTYMDLVYNLDSLKSSHQVSTNIGNPSEIEEIFDIISYKKGSTIIRMMHLFLGESFQKGVANYLKEHKYGNAEQDNLWEALTDQAHKDGVFENDMSVKTIMDSWTLQTGYPVLTVNRNYEKGSATVTQKRYLKIPEEEKEDKSCWWVPITYTTQSKKDFNDTMPKHWLDCSHQKSIEILQLPKGNDNEWVIFNIDLGALYRVQYDKQNWDLIVKTLTSDSYKMIGPMNRAGLILDVYDFAMRGDLPYELAFKLSSYLSRETEYIPLARGFDSLHAISSLLKRTSSFGLFKEYMKSLITPLYERYNKLNQVPKELEDAKLHKLAISWACKFEVGDCVTQAKELFNKWLTAPDLEKNNPIPTDLQKVVFCTAVRFSGPDIWNTLWDRYRTSNYAGEKNILLGALACSRDIWVLNRYLEWSIDEHSEVRRQDATSVFTWIMSHSTGYYVAKDFLHRRIKDIHKFFQSRPHLMGRYLTAYAKKIIFEEELAELRDFIGKNKEYFSNSKLQADQSLENAMANVKWHANNYNLITKLLSF